MRPSRRDESAANLVLRPEASGGSHGAKVSFRGEESKSRSGRTGVISSNSG